MESNNLLNSVVNEIIDQLKLNTINESLLDSSIYSINAGGKRFRPLLLLQTLETLGTDINLGIIPAASLEMIHTYSLIHDDLPAMDDDQLRRGKPTNHVVFGEATAILAGDNLLTESFNLLTKANLTATQIVELVQLYSKNAGQLGMISGQMLDIEATNKDLTIEELEEIHRNKTGELIVAAIEAATIIANSEAHIKKLLKIFGEKLGLLFQITDDILDVIGTTEALGKTVGSDEKNKKNTYVSLLGLDGAKEVKNNLRSEMFDILNELENDINISILEELVESIVNREK
ncbi:polyprenyl synthetase family protein [Phocicoccus pinnipedialis]|uniref:Farnesyl diphosphate synthase n=1 Tax=Phocicoccus pinnipedialis TaxID=110845 RepID=A0A6V7RFD5_9BACL|nr:farnesyl diphosphate synthase [Jeotgalicoccus pinnipedialis]MBP1939323.1 geranylgeranyl diphosphate synthase type II [Jeotgalicoccus pinnipedialis]CAD2075877.1 Farnesyl diphosphate synthase [Jeotgalicoccus pinnipedialis]